ncbi:hypothetical protein HOD29_05015 [archaeon]|jgi:hypothetical protein|nr:hypothetical protein [archaeon]
MKKTIYLFIGILITLASCSFSDYENVIDYYAGEKQLRKAISHKGSKTEGEAQFFLFSGNASLKSGAAISVTFSWEDRIGDYVTTTLDMEKVKVRLNEKREKPVAYLHTNLRRYSNAVIRHEYNIDDPGIVNKNIIYAIIECHPKDWTEEVNLDFQTKK